MALLSNTPIPHEAGRDLIRGKLPVQRSIFDRLLPELRARAFMVTGVESANVLQRVRDLAAELPVGGDFKELKDKILAEISPWLVTDMDEEEAAKQFREATRRAEMLLRMHGWQAYAQTQFEEMEEMKDVFPFRQYLSSEDGRVRATHAALNRKVLPADHEFWQNHTPPWEFGCRCDVVALMGEEVDELRAAEAGKAIEEREVIEGAMLDEVSRGRLVMPGGTGTLDIRTPREKKGAEGYEWRPGDRGLDMNAILSRYPADVRGEFEKWAQAEKMADGRTAWEAFGGDAATLPPAPVPVPAAVPPPAPAIAPAPAVPRVSPVSAALALKMRSKAEMKRVLDVIDDLHDDGALPSIPVVGKVSKKNLGHYCHETYTGRAVEIGVKAAGSHPGLTLAHEIGHFLDHHGMGAAGTFQSTVPGSRVGAVVDLLKATPTWKRIRNEAGGIDTTAYYESAKETWARAYAQYIAEESEDPELLRQLDSIRLGFASWRQWPAAEFAPIRDAMRTLFTDLGWNPKQPPTPKP
jgi:SPP1 gp7 family putative phage head morphogenesis protein